VPTGADARHERGPRVEAPVAGGAQSLAGVNAPARGPASGMAGCRVCSCRNHALRQAGGW
jgi:hypothetical protein